MSLSDLASLGSFASGVAVVITLIFLLLQMRQSNRNQKSLMQQGRTARMVNLILTRTNPHLAEVFARLYSADSSFEGAQLAALQAAIDATFYTFEDSYLQFKAGTLDQASWGSDAVAIKRVLAVPAFRVQWSFDREVMTGDYRDYIDQIMRETPAIRPRNVQALWQARMAEELAGAPAPAT